MRIDHHAYQQATRVAGVGLLVQGAMGLTLLVFGLMAGDSPMAAAALVVLLGLLPWGGLVALFHQHKAARTGCTSSVTAGAARTAIPRSCVQGGLHAGGLRSSTLITLYGQKTHAASRL